MQLLRTGRVRRARGRWEVCAWAWSTSLAFGRARSGCSSAPIGSPLDVTGLDRHRPPGGLPAQFAASKPPLAVAAQGFHTAWSCAK